MFYSSGGPIDWTSKLNGARTLSVTGAEIAACVEGARNALWMRGFLKELGHEQKNATVIHVDNDGAIRTSNNAVNHARNKHMEEQQWFLREHTELMSIVLKYIPTEENTADLLTKPLSSAAFDRLMLIMFTDYSEIQTNNQKRKRRQSINEQTQASAIESGTQQ